MKQTVSVIIPCYQSNLNYLHEALLSVRAQTSPIEEVILIENGPQQTITMEFCEAHAVSYYYDSKANLPMARNKGACLAKGEYLAFLDQDDIWLPEKTGLQIAAFEVPIPPFAVIGLCEMFLQDSDVKPHWLRAEFLSKALPAYLPSALMVKRELFLDTGGFVEDNAMASDVDWFLRRQNASQSITCISQTIVKKRIHTMNDSHRLLDLNKAILKALRHAAHRQELPLTF